VDLTLSHNVLTIKGEKKHENEEKGENYYRAERSYGSFQRSIALPQGVEMDDAEAAYDKGVLTVTFPKRDVEGTHKVTVKSK
jgi:HSP20 family protein